MMSLPDGTAPASVPITSSFSVADYAVFAGMLLISTSIGVYYAWTVSESKFIDFLMNHTSNMPE